MAMLPVPHKVTQNFYANATQYNYGSGHGATDYASPVGTPVVAPESGTVVFADWVWNLPGGPNDWTSRWYQIKPAVGDRHTGGGIITVIRNDIGSVWILAHLSSNEIAPVGTKVREGQIIGLSGSTGSSTGPHLHVSLLPPSPNWNNKYFGAIPFDNYMTTAYAPIANVRVPAPKPVPATGYTMIEKWTSPNRSPRLRFGWSGKPDHIVIHWWDLPEKAGTFDGTISWLLSPAAEVSAHFVVSGTRVACLVSPTEAAWHSGTGAMNGRSIGIECDPRNPTGTVATVERLIYDMEKQFGSMRIIGHRDNYGTSCPGIFYSMLPGIIRNVNSLHASKGKGIIPAPKPVSKAQASVSTQTISKKETPVMNPEQIKNSVREVLQDLNVPAKGDAKGTMRWLDSEGWNRHDRARTEERLTEIENKLEVIANGLAVLLTRTEKEVN